MSDQQQGTDGAENPDDLTGLHMGKVKKTAGMPAAVFFTLPICSPVRSSGFSAPSVPCCWSLMVVRFCKIQSLHSCIYVTPFLRRKPMRVMLFSSASSIARLE